MNCKVCQHNLIPGVAFCPNCGTPIGGSSSPNQGIPPAMLASTPLPSNPPNPSMPPSNPYGVPGAPANPYGAFSAGSIPGTPGIPGALSQSQMPPQRKKRPNTTIVAIAIVVLFLGVLAASGIIFGIVSTKKAIDAIPKTSQIDPAASAILTNVRTADGVDAKDQPIVTSSFKTFSSIDIVYTLSGHHDGYISETTYANSSGEIIAQTDTPHPVSSEDSGGRISFGLLQNAGNYTTGLYWCTQSDCSDAALAAVLTFSVS